MSDPESENSTIPNSQTGSGHLPVSNIAGGLAPLAPGAGIHGLRMTDSGCIQGANNRATLVDMRAANEKLEKQTGLDSTTLYRHQKLAKQLAVSYNDQLRLRMEKQKPKDETPVPKVAQLQLLRKVDPRHSLMRKASVSTVIEVNNARQQIQTSESSLKHYENIIKELVHTEQDYVTDILTCITLYLIPMRDSTKIITAEEARTLFYNIEDIIVINKQLLSAFSAEAKKKHEEQDFGGIFNHYSTILLKSYSPFCSNLVLARRMKNKLISNRPAFASFIELAAHDPCALRQDLKSFLIKPLQRLCKYPLLLKEMRKYSPSASACRSLDDAIMQMGGVLDEVNQTMLDSDEQEQLLDIQDMFSDMPIKLVQTYRKFVSKGIFLHYATRGKKIRKQNCTLVLVTDLLLVVQEESVDPKTKRVAPPHLTALIPLIQCNVALDCPEKPPGLAKGELSTEHHFFLRHTSPTQSEEWGITKFIFICEDAKEKTKWFNMIKQQININLTFEETKLD